MAHYKENEGGTHTIPMALQLKLVEAKAWYDDGMVLAETIRRTAGPGSAQRNAEDMDAHDRGASELLRVIVEMCDAAWGFAPPRNGG